MMVHIGFKESIIITFIFILQSRASVWLIQRAGAITTQSTRVTQKLLYNRTNGPQKLTPLHSTAQNYYCFKQVIIWVLEQTQASFRTAIMALPIGVQTRLEVRFFDNHNRM